MEDGVGGLGMPVLSIDRQLGSGSFIPAPNMSQTESDFRDEDRGFQLFQSDPSGNYGGWKATAIGGNHQAAQNILKQDFKEDITLEEAVKLVIKVCATPARNKELDWLWMVQSWHRCVMTPISCKDLACMCGVCVAC